MVERMVADGLWELFQRVVPEAPTRPQGGGRRRHGDREVLAAIIFVATTGCTWASSQRCSAPPGRPHIGVSPSGVGPACGRSCTVWSWANSVPGVSWTGRGAVADPFGDSPIGGWKVLPPVGPAHQLLPTFVVGQGVLDGDPT